MQFLKRFLPSFLVSWLISFTLASLFHSQYVVNQLVNVGVVIELNERLKLTLDDWFGLLPTYGIILVIALALAFLVTGGLFRKSNQYRHLLYSLAGLAAVAVVLLSIESLMNINVIAGARGFGFYMQLVAGAVGGFVFALLVKPIAKDTL